MSIFRLVFNFINIYFYHIKKVNKSNKFHDSGHGGPKSTNIDAHKEQKE
jgi:hypothetical protein